MQGDTFLSEISVGSKKKNICDIDTLWRAYVLITTIINTNNIVNCLNIVLQTVPVEITFKEFSKIYLMVFLIVYVFVAVLYLN